MRFKPVKLILEITGTSGDSEGAPALPGWELGVAVAWEVCVCATEDIIINIEKTRNRRFTIFTPAEQI